jgi:multisubunit Na+/H+ antiporter MnhB subunit
MRFDFQTLKQPLEALIVLFYVAMALALLTALAGSPGWGFLFLVFGSGVLVIRTTMETLQSQQGRPSQGPPPPANR